MALPDSYTETEVQIFEAALQLFSRKGKDGARMQEIADEAGINKAMLHYYFRSKDKLYYEVVAYVMRRFLASFGETLRDASTFADTLRLFIEAYIDFVAAHPHILRLLVMENLSGGSVMGTHIRTLMEVSELAPPRLFASRMAEAVARGEIRPMDPFQTLLTTISGCVLPILVAPTFRAILPDATQDTRALLEARKKHLFDLIYNGLRAHPDVAR